VLWGLFWIIVAIALEETVRLYLPVLLPWTWLLILGVITWQVLDSRLRKLASSAAVRKHAVRSYIIVAVLGAGLFVGYWYLINRLLDRPPSEQSATADSLDVVLRRVSGGGDSGLLYKTPESWFWLIKNLTVVNQGNVAEAVSFELRVPTGEQNIAILSPLVKAPSGIGLPPETRLLSVEPIPAGESVTGALLFELDRRRIPNSDVQLTEIGESFDSPDTRLAEIAIVSQLSNLERVFGSITLVERVKPTPTSSR